MDILFYDEDGQPYVIEDLRDGLRNIGAADCETLFIHSDVMFGRPAEGFKRREYLKILYEVLLDLGVKNIIVPTFTYSFPNHEDYDITNSKTSMGVFNEYVRKLDGRFRTDDPLLSLSVPQDMEERFSNVSSHSLGTGSGLDIIHHMDGVKFLFLGAVMSECFTYVHYVEKKLNVPYRFDMSFEGNVIYPDGRVEKRTQIIHTQCGGVKLPERYNHFEMEMEERGLLRKERMGDKYIACIAEKDAYQEIGEHIKSNPFYFVSKPYTDEDLTHIYTYDYTKGRITHC